MAEKPPLPAQMFNLITGRWVTQLIYVAAQLEIADLLKDGPRTVEELASAAGAQAPALYRVLRALASYGVFAEIKDKRFKLTPLASMLRKDVPGSLRGLAIMTGEKYQVESWGNLLYGVKTGQIPFQKAHGVHYFEYLQSHPEELKTFAEAMAGLSATEGPAIAAAYKFSLVQTLVDVGGGTGRLLATILKANPKLHGILFDLPAVSAEARKNGHCTDKAIAARCSHESGSFFEAVPRGGDAYIIKRVLHDWDDEHCSKILSNCRAAMNEKGRVLVVETVIPPGNGLNRGKLLDIQMLAMGGQERTKQEFAELFRKSGLKLTRVLPTKCPLSIVEGVRG